MEARPPERTLGRSGEKCSEMLFAQSLEAGEGIAWQQARGMGLEELVESIMQGRTAVGGAEFGFQRIEPVESEDAPGVQAVGVTSPFLAARHRKLRRSRFDRRPRLGPPPRPVISGPGQRPRPGAPRAPAAPGVWR